MKTPLEKAKACCGKLHDRGTDKLLAAIAAAPDQGRIVSAMKEIAAKCPEARRVEVQPTLSLDVRTGAMRLRRWEIWIWGGPSSTNLDGSGDSKDLNDAVAEAIGEYRQNIGTRRPAAEVEADNAAALEEVERFDPMCGPMGLETDRDRHNDDDAQRAAQGRADAAERDND